MVDEGTQPRQEERELDPVGHLQVHADRMRANMTPGLLAERFAFEGPEADTDPATYLGSAEAFSGRRLLPAPWTIPLSQFHGTMDMNFPIAGARMGRDRLIAAGHMVYWHEFDGGHTTNAMYSLTMFDDLASSERSRPAIVRRRRRPDTPFRKAA